MTDREQQQIQNDTIASWEFSEIFGSKLDVQVIDKENSWILTDVYAVSPRMEFSFQIFKTYSISCFKGFTHIK